MVPCGWHGGWTFDAVASRRRDRGHEVHAVTPRGLEAERDETAEVPNLDAHVPDDGDSCWALTSDHFRDLFLAGATRLREDPEWTVHDLPVGHDLMNRAPDALAELLDDAAGRATRRA